MLKIWYQSHTSETKPMQTWKHFVLQ